MGMAGARLPGKAGSRAELGWRSATSAAHRVIMEPSLNTPAGVFSGATAEFGAAKPRPVRFWPSPPARPRVYPGMMEVGSLLGHSGQGPVARRQRHSWRAGGRRRPYSDIVVPIYYKSDEQAARRDIEIGKIMRSRLPVRRPVGGRAARACRALRRQARPRLRSARGGAILRGRRAPPLPPHGVVRSGRCMNIVAARRPSCRPRDPRLSPGAPPAPAPPGSGASLSRRAACPGAGPPPTRAGTIGTLSDAPPPEVSGKAVPGRGRL